MWYNIGTVKKGKVHNMDIIRMRYRDYKDHYADCKTVAGSYSTSNKTIEVIVPEGRMKPSGVRGKYFMEYQLWCKDETTGKYYYSCYRATSKENAKKQHITNCKRINCVPCPPPDGKEEKIYK